MFAAEGLGEFFGIDFVVAADQRDDNIFIR